jgi:hypothetical protein
MDEAIGQLLDCDWNLEVSYISLYNSNSALKTIIIKRAIQNVYDNNPREKREQLEEEVASSAESSAENSAAPTPPTNSSNNHPQFRQPRQRQPANFIMRLLYWPIGFAWNITLTLLSIACKID